MVLFLCEPAAILEPLSITLQLSTEIHIEYHNALDCSYHKNLEIQCEPMLLDELLHKYCGGVMLRPMGLVKSAFPRIFYYREICAHVGLHLHKT